MRNNTVSLVLILLLSLAALYIALPIAHPAWLDRAPSPGTDGLDTLRNLKLGLDLQGGTQVLLEADLPEGQELTGDEMDAARTIVENRVNGLGVAESVVQKQGSTRLIVELPGVDNPDQAVETVRSTGQLEFIDPQGLDLGQGMVINTTQHPALATDLQASIQEGVAAPAPIPYPDVKFQTVMTGDILRTALATQDQFNQWQINFELTGDGSDQFFEYTRGHIGEPLAIVLDGRVLSAPIINAAIRDSGVIQGTFTRDEAESLGVQMRYGALPVPLKAIDIRTIGASLGQDSVDRSVRAGLIGLVAVVIFMITIYRVPGVIASVALLIYIILNVAVYKLIPVTLTLPGIAGFVLSIGMAVDANVLIFERMKEELRTGRSLRLAVEAGFSRAWPAIRDGNLATLITCAVLFWFGNTFGASTVKGFAVTLGLGVLFSMFTAVVVTRTFMRAFLVGSRKVAESRSALGY